MVNGKPKVAFLAIRDIAKGEEILWNYGHELQRSPPEWMKKKQIPSPSSTSSTDQVYVIKLCRVCLNLIYRTQLQV